jgi:hypothetical protein
MQATTNTTGYVSVKISVVSGRVKWLVIGAQPKFRRVY